MFLFPCDEFLGMGYLGQSLDGFFDIKRYSQTAFQKGDNAVHFHSFLTILPLSMK